MNICYIIGALEDSYKFNKYQGDIIIAADAGYNNLKGKKADFVVGDFDSLGYVPQNENIIKHPVRKDDTDTMLAVKIGLDSGYKNFVIMGGMGGKIDHTIANIQVLAYLNKEGAKGALVKDGVTAVMLSEGEIHFDKSASGRISVFSYSPVCRGVFLSGLEYPLENADLINSFPLGVSNSFTGAPAVVKVKEGTSLIIWEDSLDRCDYMCDN